MRIVGIFFEEIVRGYSAKAMGDRSQVGNLQLGKLQLRAPSRSLTLLAVLHITMVTRDIPPILPLLRPAAHILAALPRRDRSPREIRMSSKKLSRARSDPLATGWYRLTSFQLPGLESAQVPPFGSLPMSRSPNVTRPARSCWRRRFSRATQTHQQSKSTTPSHTPTSLYSGCAPTVIIDERQGQAGI
jgi:hypothetical protein